MSMLRNRVYYRVKPFIPLSLRTAVRRRLAFRLRRHVADIWPIMPGSDRLPENWPGWPEEKRFAVILTHDVESAAGVQRCQQLAQLERRLGFRSSFNFIPEGNYTVLPELRAELTKQGFEIGIHDLHHDGRLFASQREFSRKAGRINDYLRDWNATGFRSGFMLHRLDWLHELNIQYDTSTFDTDPFEPQPEGRHTIFPFWVPCRRLASNSITGIQDGRASNCRNGYVELPYTLPQDSTLFLLLREQTIDIWKQKVNWIAARGGMVLVDTHPDYMAFDAKQKSNEYSVTLYEQFLQYLKSRYRDDYWHALPREVAGHIMRHRSVATLAEPNGREPRFATEIVTGGGRLEAIASRGLENRWRLPGKRAAVLLFSYYPADPRPLRAAETMASEGIAVDLFCLQQFATDAKREKINGVNVFRFPLSRQRGGKARYVRQYAAFIASAFITLARRSFRRRYDLIHVHNMPDALVFSALVPKLLGAKVILDLHDPMPELMQSIFSLSENSLSVRFLKNLERWSIRFSDAVLTVNLACKKIYSGRSCPSEKITVVMNTPDEGVFPAAPPPANLYRNGNAERPFTILYHGSLVRRNGFDLAVEAVDRVRERVPQVQLLVCGERTSFFEEVMDSARKRKVDFLVRHLGMKNRREIVEIIGECDLGIIPNHRNLFTEINTPTRIFEYLAIGKPVIAPKAEGILDYFEQDELVFFELGDAADLARQIEYVYFHPTDVQETVKRGQQVYLAHRWKAEKMNLLRVASELV